MNEIIEISAVKKEFNKNSSIEIKNYLLDKNEKKLFKGDNFIILTEKEIQLLDLFLTKKKKFLKLISCLRFGIILQMLILILLRLIFIG